jgi:hypothetical protein
VPWPRVDTYDKSLGDAPACSTRYTGLASCASIVAWWWALLTLVSSALWFVLYRQFRIHPDGSLDSAFDTRSCYFLCAAYDQGDTIRLRSGEPVSTSRTTLSPHIT